MSLDEQTLEFLAKSNPKPTPSRGEISLPEFRAAVERFRALGFEREEVAVVKDVALPRANAPDVSVRIYRPEDEHPVPVMVWAHGGSWVRVTVDLLDGHFRVMANRSGCAIVAVDYQLSPEARFPAAIEETYAAALWIKDHGRNFSLDTTRIGVGGESSGGNLAAAVALLDRERGDVGFAYQVLLVPVLDLRFDTPSWKALGEGFLLTRPQLEWALTQYAPDMDRTDPLLSPLYASSHGGLPPALIRTGEYDPLKDEGAAYAASLRRSGVDVDHIEVAGLIHHAVMAPGLLDTGRRLVTESAAAFGDALSGTR